MIDRGYETWTPVQSTPEIAAASRIATWLRTIRERRGCSQEWVAHTADIAVTTYGRMERPSCSGSPSNPTLTTFVRVLVALEVDASEMGELVDDDEVSTASSGSIE
jgi:transcriptional regulator with XRE-family HTH domain